MPGVPHHQGNRNVGLTIKATATLAASTELGCVIMFVTVAML